MEISSTQKFFKFFISREKFEKMKAESMLWVFQCDCGNEFSIWDAGGIRYNAKGEPYKMARCPQCQKSALRKLTKKNVH